MGAIAETPAFRSFPVFPLNSLPILSPHLPRRHKDTFDNFPAVPPSLPALTDSAAPA